MRIFNFRKRKININNKNGFTLVELMVVCAVIMILSVYIAANYHQGNSESGLTIAAEKLTQDLRRVQEWAYAAQQFEGVSFAGYGINIKNGEANYILYTDNNANGYYNSTDKTRETITLENNFSIKDIKPCKPSESCGSLTSLSVNFIPPDPGVVITNGSNKYDTATIVLGINGTETTRAIIVNRAGLIYVK